MPPPHRPDFEAFRKESAHVKSKGTKYRDHYIWPYINIEDLAQGRSLLIFINSRGRHPPRMFAHADFEAASLGRVTAAIMLPFLNVHTMYLDGEVVATYGRLTSWDEDEDGMDAVFQGQAYQPGEGLMILEIQQKLLTFLVQCCQAILHDLDLKSLADG